MIYSQDSTLISNCKRLGSVSSEINSITRATEEEGITQIKNNLRDQAFRQYGADSVALLNLDTSSSKIKGEGIALQCNGL